MSLSVNVVHVKRHVITPQSSDSRFRNSNDNLKIELPHCDQLPYYAESNGRLKSGL